MLDNSGGSSTLGVNRAKRLPTYGASLRRSRRDVQVTHAPAVLFDLRGRGYVEQGPLTSHWSLFLPDAGASGPVLDVAASRDRARAQLGVRGSSSVAPSVGSADLARRLFEYLQLHRTSSSST